MIEPRENGDTKYDSVMRVYKDLKEIRARYEPEWEKINDLVLPRRSDFDWVKHQVRKNRRQIYDPLPGYLARKAADGILGNSVNRGQTWFRIHSTDPQLDRSRIFRLYIEEVEQILYSLMRMSTLYEASHDATMDCLTVGHSALYREVAEDTQKVIYTARHPKEIYIAENRYGQVDTVVREFWMEAREIVDEFDDLPERFVNDANANKYEPKKLVHLVRPRRDRDLTKNDKWNKPWESIYVLEDYAKVIRESGYDRLPYPAIWRWRTNTGEAYGRSPSWDALPDIVRLNEVSRTMIQFVQETIDPALQYPLEMKGRIDRRPRGMTPYTDPSRRVHRLIDNNPNSYPLAFELIGMMRDQISEAFYADVFTVLTMHADKDRTATEVIELTNERTALLSAVIERFISEFATPVISDLYELAADNNWLPEMPEALIGQPMGVTLEFLGPLAQGQRRHYNTTGLNAAMQQIASSAQLWPEVLDIVNPAAFSRLQMQAAGLAEKAMRTDAEVQQIQRQRAELAQAEAEAQMMQQQASAYAQTQKAPERGSPAEGMS